VRPGPAARGLEWLTAVPIAHRGLHDGGSTLENTPSAFAAAIRKGYPIECDIQLTADGEAIVFHDDDLGRLTNAGGPVASRSAADIRKLPLRSSPDRIPTFGDMLQQVGGRVPLIVEIKSQWNDDATLARRAIDVASGYGGKLAFMSYDPTMVEALALGAPGLPRGIVADRMTHSYWNRMPFGKRLELRHFTHWNRTRPHFVSFDAHGLPWGPVRQVRASGLPVICWTIRSREEASEALRHCDQITFEGYFP
jgi:glycerophosphoryl diester phosphodiesterase